MNIFNKNTEKKHFICEQIWRSSVDFSPDLDADHTTAHARLRSTSSIYNVNYRDEQLVFPGHNSNKSLAKCQSYSLFFLLHIHCEVKNEKSYVSQTIK